MDRFSDDALPDDLVICVAEMLEVQTLCSLVVTAKGFRFLSTVPPYTTYRHYFAAARRFNRIAHDADSFDDALVSLGIVGASNTAVFFHRCMAVLQHREALGEYLGDPDHKGVLLEFLALYSFAGKSLVGSLRMLFRDFWLPKAAQNIDHILESFALAWYQSGPRNQEQFTDYDTVYILSYATIMLNTDLYNRHIKPHRKMSIDKFRRVNSGLGLADQVLTEIYESVRSNEIKGPSARMEQRRGAASETILPMQSKRECAVQ